jgi:hypothetical protein
MPMVEVAAMKTPAYARRAHPHMPNQSPWAIESWTRPNLAPSPKCTTKVGIAAQTAAVMVSRPERDATAQEHGREELVLPVAQPPSHHRLKPEERDDAERREVEAEEHREPVPGHGVPRQVLGGGPDSRLATEQVDRQREQHGCAKP